MRMSNNKSEDVLSSFFTLNAVEEVLLALALAISFCCSPDLWALNHPTEFENTYNGTLKKLVRGR